MPLPTISTSRVTLSTTALVLLVLVLLQLGGQSSTPVQADMLTEGNGYTMLTMSGRTGALDKEVQSLLIVDNTAGWLLAYELKGSQPNRTIELLDGGSLSRFFDHGQPSSSRVPRP